jgi:hypothetical protein
MSVKKIPLAQSPRNSGQPKLPKMAQTPLREPSRATMASFLSASVANERGTIRAALKIGVTDTDY